MFNLNDLIYQGNQNGLDVFSYHGVRIDAVLTNERDGQYIFVGMSSPLPDYILSGLFAWFGIDSNRRYSRFEFPDQSRYFVQKKAA